MRFELTDHAVQRFQERICPHLEFGEARYALSYAVERASLTKEKSTHGHDIYMVDKPACRLVVPPKIEDGKMVVVTVLPPNVETHLIEMAHMQHQLSMLNRRTRNYLTARDEADHKEQRVLLSLEIDILRIETAGMKAKERVSWQDLLHREKSDKTVECLRIATKALRGDIDRQEAIAIITAIEPKYMKAAFNHGSDPDKDDK